MMSDIPPPFDLAWFRFAVGFIVGAIVGSFGTMLAYRLPRRLSIVAPRSHCPSCKTPLGVSDLVPMLSWLLGGGRCRHCGAKIGMRYLWIELGCSLACGIMAVLFF
jgi:prepilin signal peptidase PulO-like enzyme (type II secretory pathway)